MSLLIKSNKWSIINAEFLLVELLPPYMWKPTSSEKRRLYGRKKGLKSILNKLKLFCPHIFDQLVEFY